MAQKKIQKILVVGDKKFYVRDTTQDYHLQYGFVKKEDLLSPAGSIVKTNKGKELRVFDPSHIDQFEKISRAPQIIPAKDVGAIITRCGITRESIVVDAGSGSGALAITLGAIAKKVHTFDVREDHVKIASDNVVYMGLTNVEVKHHDIYESCPVKNVDVFTLDVPEPWNALNSARTALKVGGFLVSYSPCIPQVADFCNAVHDSEDFQHLDTIEIVEREWEVKGRKVRPRSRTSIHSGFLTFVRKIQ